MKKYQRAKRRIERDKRKKAEKRRRLEMEHAKKIYIAGKITGTTDYLERFSKAEEYLTSVGYEGRVINPAKISAGLPPESTTYRDYIRIGLSMLDTCEEIYMLTGWEESLGASLELQYAITLGYKIHFEGGNFDEECTDFQKKTTGI